MGEGGGEGIFEHLQSDKNGTHRVEVIVVCVGSGAGGVAFINSCSVSLSLFRGNTLEMSNLHVHANTNVHVRCTRHASGSARYIMRVQKTISRTDLLALW